MKKILVLLVAGSILFACNNKKEDTKTETKTEEKTTTPDTATTQVPPPVSTSEENISTTTGGWSTSDENRFMRDCESTAAPKVGTARAYDYCDCMLKKIKGLYKSYMEADRGLANDEAAMNRLAAECNAQQ